MSTPDDPTPYDENDPLAARLRAALTSEADMVTPSDDGLRSIRDGIGASRRPWWQHPAAPALAAAAVLGLMAGGIAVLFSGGDGQTVVAGPGSSTSSAGEPSSLPAPSSVSTSVPPSTSSAVPVPIEGGVYVYYVMDDGQGTRLVIQVAACGVHSAGKV